MKQFFLSLMSSIQWVTVRRLSISTKNNKFKFQKKKPTNLLLLNILFLSIIICILLLNIRNYYFKKKDAE